MVALLTVWCCPICRGRLAEEIKDARLCCVRCGTPFEVIAGIPDLRVARPSWVDVDADREGALQLDRDTRGETLEAVIRRVFARQPHRTAAEVDYRVRQVLASPGRLHRQVHGWLRSVALTPGYVDVGCGPGLLLAASAQDGVSGLGIDASLEWLVIARRMIQAHGGRATLCAALCEALPLPDGSAPAIASLDVIEHCGDQRRHLREIDRIAAPSAAFALATPNRFSVTAEPHVGVWGVGWLPARWQRRYVRLRSGKPYDFVRLLSVPGLKRLLKRETHFDGRFIVPRIPDEEIELFEERRAKLARTYNRIAERRMLRWPLFAIGPFFRFVGVRRSDVGRRAARMPTELAVPIRRGDEVRAPEHAPRPSPRRDPAHPPAPRGD
ncbi:MAG TPA: class I SAM-dependent methyltransferase [Gemmatimonadaceae bacterium]